MKASDIATLATFITRHAAAWEAFRAYATSDPSLASFEYCQNRGGWVATLAEGETIVFRDFCDKVVAICMIHATLVSTGTEYIYCGVPRA